MRCFMYTPDYSRRGILPTLGGSLVLRNNDVSTFTVDVNGDDPLADRFDKGWRVVIEDRGIQYLAGAVNRIGRTSKDGIQDLTLSGVDDMAWLRDMITLPDPSKAADRQDQDAYFVRSKQPAQKTMHSLIRQLVANDARPEFKRRCTLEFPTGPGPGAEWYGDDVSLNTRFKNLLEEVQGLGLAGGVLARSWQDDATQQTVFGFRTGRDYSRAVRLTERNGGLTDWELTEEAPEVTSVLVAGQGEGENRTLKLVEGNENDWGFRAIQFQDRRDTDELDQLIQAGEETLESGVAKSTISLEIGETDRARFGEHFWLGDTITVQLADGSSVTDIVQSAEISFDENGREVKLTIGPVLDEQDAPRWVPLVKRLMKEIRGLQAR